MIPFLIVLVAVCFSVVGELLLKAGMNDVGVLSFSNFFPTMVKIFSHPRILLGFGSIGIGAIFWLAAISRANLSWAYPMLSMGYILVLILSATFLKEEVSAIRWIGALVVCAGVILISRS